MPRAIRASQRLWETPEVTQINRLPAHSCLIPYQDLGTALGHDRDDSTWFHRLDGTWKFALLDRPEDTDPASLGTAFDDREWTDTAVHGH